MTTTLSNAFSVGVSTPQPSGTTPPGTLMPPATQIVDSTGAVWTVIAASGGAPGQVGMARNGIRKSSSVDFGTIDSKGVFWESDFKSGQGWEFWNGNGWTASTTPPA